VTTKFTIHNRTSQSHQYRAAPAMGTGSLQYYSWSTKGSLISKKIA